jgi:hypothetical protein
MSRLALASVAVLAFGLAQTASAQQQPACTKRTDILNHLANKYSEAPVAIGLANNGGVLEVLSSQSGKSWTIILTMPNGTACMIAAGENWESVPQSTVFDPNA